MNRKQPMKATRMAGARTLSPETPCSVGWKSSLLRSPDLLRALTGAVLSLCALAPLAHGTDETLRTKTQPVAGVPGAVVVKENGFWCWIQDPRVMVTSNGQIILNSVSGATYGGFTAGDIWATAWKPGSAEALHSKLSSQIRPDRPDDHDAGGMLELPDGRILVVYGGHSVDNLQRWRITRQPRDIAGWSPESTLDVGARYSYSNVYRLEAEDGRIYNFTRSIDWDPNAIVSDDDGETWRPAWRLVAWGPEDIQGDPRTGTSDMGKGRPYPRYASNGKDTIHFIMTDDHPVAYASSVYHGFYRGGKLHDSFGNVVGETGDSAKTDCKPRSFTEIFKGSDELNGWVVDLELDAKGYPRAVFQAGDLKKGGDPETSTFRYYYAAFDGKTWHVHPMAHAGSRLYPGQPAYTGLAAIDPDAPDTVVISTNAHPETGQPLVSEADGKTHWELFRGVTRDLGQSWEWAALTANSTANNLRPVIPANPGGERIIAWGRGTYPDFRSYRMDICLLTEKRD
ncbi:MAG: BNR-4 repeat-containing protein [Chthoniobacterales bacterium]